MDGDDCGARAAEGDGVLEVSEVGAQAPHAAGEASRPCAAPGCVPPGEQRSTPSGTSSGWRVTAAKRSSSVSAGSSLRRLAT